MKLQKKRKQITEIDKEIIDLIEKRMELINEITEIKKQKNKSIQDEEREKELISEYTDYAAEKPIDAGYIKQIYEIILEMSKEKQKNLMGEGNLL